MSVVSVINYKGGVGKTTLTANLGAGLAARGRSVLLIDLDPQASLTFSLVTPERWRKDLAQDRTIKNWYDSFAAGSSKDLSDFLLSPRRITDRLRRLPNAGVLQLIPSHLGLINVDLELASELGGGSLRQAKLKYLRVHRRLADALSNSAFDDWEVILIDCPPNFNVVTKTAIVASDHILIPAKADYLSTLGIDYLGRSLEELVTDYNDYATYESPNSGAKIDPEIMGVIFTMVQYYAQQPIAALRPFMQQTRDLGVPVFDNMMRENKTHFGDVPQGGIPLILSDLPTASNLVGELEALVDEFETEVGV